ncbi:hypothetical protein ACJBU6_04861 [Exserohilum turcicum]
MHVCVCVCVRACACVESRGREARMLVVRFGKVQRYTTWGSGSSPCIAAPSRPRTALACSSHGPLCTLAPIALRRRDCFGIGTGTGTGTGISNAAAAAAAA